MALDKNTLLQEVNCFTCLGISIPQALIIALLQRIVEQTMGVFPNLLGSGSPIGVVTPAGPGQFYSDTTNDVLWQAFGPTDTDWHQWI